MTAGTQKQRVWVLLQPSSVSTDRLEAPRVPVPRPSGGTAPQFRTTLQSKMSSPVPHCRRLVQGAAFHSAHQPHTAPKLTLMAPQPLCLLLLR